MTHLPSRSAALLTSLLLVGSVAGCSSSDRLASSDGGSGDRGDASDAHAPPPHANRVAALSELTVTSLAPGDGAPAPALTPSFTPAVHDYYVRCGAGPNSLRLSMKAAPGAESLVLRPTLSPSRPAQVVSLSVREGQAIVAAATNAAATTEYWIRCLPHDFPQMLWSPHPEAGEPPPGYYLVGDQRPVSGAAGYAMLLDGHGVPVWYYATPDGRGAIDVDEVVPGSISFIAPTSSADRFEFHDLATLATTYVEAPEDVHDLRVLPNGDVLVLQTPSVPNVDLTGLSMEQPDGGKEPLGPSTTIQTCVVQEIDPKGAVVWQWAATDHFDPVLDSIWPVDAQLENAEVGEPISVKSRRTGGGIVDVFHCNSIDVDPATGNLLVSARQMDAIFYIEKASGEVLWKMGGARASKDAAPYISVADPFHGQHDARLLPGFSYGCDGTAGQISLFDDETAKPGPARAVVYHVVVGRSAGQPGCKTAPSGASGGTATIAWRYEGKASSGAMGSFRISPDGSRVIGWGANASSPHVVFSEVDRDGSDLVDFEFTDGNDSYRAVKVPRSAFDLARLHEITGIP